MALAALMGCSSEAPPPYRPPAAPEGHAAKIRWWPSLPARVRVEACAPEIEEAATYWEDAPGTVFRMVRSGPHDVRARIADLPDQWGGAARPVFRCWERCGEEDAPGELVSVDVRVTECDVVAIAHELGHALGMGHATRDGALMRATIHGEHDGDDVSAWERDAARATP